MSENGHKEVVTDLETIVETDSLPSAQLPRNRLTPAQVQAIQEHESRKRAVRQLQVQAYELRAQEDVIREKRETIESQIRQDIASLNAEAALINLFVESLVG